MDTTLLVSVVIAVVAIVPGVWALVNQARKDKIQATLDMNKAANDAAMSIISPLQTEVSRLQNRVLELEKSLVEKTTEIGKLMQEGIDKDTKIRSLEYNIEGMKLKLESFEIAKRRKSKPTDDEIDNRIEEELRIADEKKEKIKLYTDRAIEKITNGSMAKNLTNTETEE